MDEQTQTEIVQHLESALEAAKDADEWTVLGRIEDILSVLSNIGIAID